MQTEIRLERVSRPRAVLDLLTSKAALIQPRLVVLAQTWKARLLAVTAWMTEPASAQELFRGRHFDQEIIVLCVRWYLTFKLSSRDLVQMMAESGIGLAHTTILRWCSGVCRTLKSAGTTERAP
jgi:hypothetical protein